MFLEICGYFYVLSRSTMTPRLCRVALCSRWTVEVSDAVSFMTSPGCPRKVPCNWVLNAIVLFVHGVDNSLWLTVKINPNHSVWATTVQVLTTWSGIHLCRAWHLPRSPFEYSVCELTGSCSDVIWNWPLGVLVLRPLGRDSVVVQCQMLPMTGPEQSV